VTLAGEPVAIPGADGEPAAPSSPGSTYLDRLAARSAATGTVLCLGLDPDPAALPDGFPRDLRGVEAFAALLLEAALPAAAAVKPNLAFFEAFGSAGLAALERLRVAIPSDVPVVMDAKRGDIGSTAARQAVALFDGLGADAITVSPYLGEEAIAPLLARSDRFAYVLCRTSNPGAGELQRLRVDADAEAGWPAEPLYARVARRAAAWGPGGTVGLVVGATAPDELAEIRRIAPGLGFLVPGVGAQGGDEAAVLRDGRALTAPAGGRPGGGLLVNVSRGIAGAAGATSATTRVGEGSGRGRHGDPGAALAQAARDWAARLPVLP
jgi:orotidine-5'-phosphate decarboxylase